MPVVRDAQSLPMKAIHTMRMQLHARDRFGVVHIIYGMSVENKEMWLAACYREEESPGSTSFRAFYTKDSVIDCDAPLTCLGCIAIDDGR